MSDIDFGERKIERLTAEVERLQERVEELEQDLKAALIQADNGHRAVQALTRSIAKERREREAPGVEPQGGNTMMDSIEVYTLVKDAIEKLAGECVDRVLCIVLLDKASVFAEIIADLYANEEVEK